MGLQDGYGNMISTASDAARNAYDKGVKTFLEAGHGAVEAFEAALRADEAFALAHAGHARALMMTGDMAAAKAAIARAGALESAMDARERAHVAIMGMVVGGKPAEARAAVWEHVQAHPRDAMVAQLSMSVFGLIGFSGEVGREAELLAFTTFLRPHYGDDWWMASMHALALCETGKVPASLDLMERSLAANPLNANAAHFKAHGLYEAGETDEGRAFLRSWVQSYDDRSVLHGHLWWHLALWALHSGDEAGMWEATDRGVTPDVAKGLPINIVSDTAAIYFRAELSGIKVGGERWSRLSDYASEKFTRPGQCFVDLHAGIAHARAGHLDRLEAIGGAGAGFAGDLMAPVAHAWKAMASQDWAEVRSALEPIIAVHERLGGSRAQRDMLELAYATALAKTGHRDEALRGLSIRREVLVEAFLRAPGALAG